MTYFFAEGLSFWSLRKGAVAFDNNIVNRKYNTETLYIQCHTVQWLHHSAWALSGMLPCWGDKDFLLPKPYHGTSRTTGTWSHLPDMQWPRAQNETYWMKETKYNKTICSTGVVCYHFILLHCLLQFFLLEKFISIHLSSICCTNSLLYCHVTASFPLYKVSTTEIINFFLWI